MHTAGVQLHSAEGPLPAKPHLIVDILLRVGVADEIACERAVGASLRRALAHVGLTRILEWGSDAIVGCEGVLEAEVVACGRRGSRWRRVS